MNFRAGFWPLTFGLNMISKGSEHDHVHSVSCSIMLAKAVLRKKTLPLCEIHDIAHRGLQLLLSSLARCFYLSCEVILSRLTQK